MIFDRITSDPAVMSGQPCIRGTRITVRRALEVAALYPDRAKRQSEFPELQDEDFRQALLFAASQLHGGSQTAGMTDEEFTEWMVAQGAQPMSAERYAQLANSAGFGSDASGKVLKSRRVGGKTMGAEVNLNREEIARAVRADRDAR